jgi:hypothetical protein
VIFQFSGPVIIDHSDMPPIPANNVNGMKIVVIKVRRLTIAFVSFEDFAIWLFSMDRYISMRLVTISRDDSVNSDVPVKVDRFFRDEVAVLPAYFYKDLAFVEKTLAQS